MRKRPSRIWRWCRDVTCISLRFSSTVFTIAALAAGVLYLRLLQGPVEIPALGDTVAAQINAGSENAQIAIGSLSLSLGEGGAKSGLQFREVVVSDDTGAPLFTVPKVAVSLALADLINGRVQPTEITVLAPDATLVRRADGLLHFGMGEGAGLALAPDPAAEGSQTFERVVDVLAGNRPGPAAFAALKRVQIDGARLTYEDRLNGGVWGTQDAQIDLVRHEGGFRAALSVAVIDQGTPGAAVRLVAEKARGAETARLEASFGRIRTAVLSGQLPALDWLDVLEGTMEGRASAVLARDGTVTALDGVLIAEQGRLRGFEPASEFDVFEVQFSADPVAETVALERVTLSANAIDTRLRGVAELRRGADGALTGLAGQLDVDGLYVRLPELFKDVLEFDDGQINFRWYLDRARIEVAGTRLAKDDLTFVVDGRAQQDTAGWITDLRVEAVNMDAGDLVSHWPIAAATNARTWVAENIPVASVDSFLAQMRFGDGEPYLSLDFDYSDLTARYLRGMPPIEGAQGRGHMSYHALYLEMDHGFVTPPGGEPISLAGSSLDITGFWGEPVPADVSLRAEGRTRDVLALIDHQPLGLVSKLGVALGPVGGQATVDAELNFPLLAALRIADVEAVATASLASFSMPFTARNAPPVQVRADRLALEADTQAMRLRGPITADGQPMTLDWREIYGATPDRRSVTLGGRAGPALLGLIGAQDVPLDAPVPFSLDLAQAGTAPLTFALETDLTPARLAFEPLDWAKPAGAAGRLTASGILGDAVTIDAFELSAGELQAVGAMALAPSGEVRRVDFSRLAVPGLGHVRGHVEPSADGAIYLTLTGGDVDISRHLTADRRDKRPGQAVRVRLGLDRLQVSEKMVFTETDGMLSIGTDGHRRGTFDAAIGRGAPISVAFDLPAEGRGRINLSSPDAGAVLAEADLYRGARGGRLMVDAVIGDGSGAEISGRLRIEDVIVRSEATFQSVLRDGGLSEAESEVAQGGLRFRKVWVPFAYRDGIITLTDAVASSPALALKVNGTLDEATENMDLIGVLSPAYAVTGALNEIPVLGDLLSGGDGEGILAMTFTLRGAMRDPDLAVNPLSLLAPGFLRRVFSTRTATPDPEFLDRLNRANQR